MKNCSLVRKFGSCVGSATLALNLFSSVGSQSVAAAGSFLESKFFKIVYKLISDDDLKVFNADAFWEQQTTKKGVNVDSLKKRNLIFLIKLKKFCDIMSRDKDIQNNELKKEKIDALKCDVEKVLVGDISEKIDEFFKSDFFKDNISCFTGIKNNAQNFIINFVLTLKDEALLRNFKQLYQNYNLYLVIFCYSHFEDLATTFYNRINMLLYLGRISDFGSGVLKAGEEYLERDSEEFVLAQLNRIKAYSEDLIKSGILTEEQLYEVLHTCYQFLTIIDMKYQDEVNKLVSCKEEGSFRKYISELAQASSIYKTRVIWLSDPRFKKILAADKKLQASLKKAGLDSISQENCFFDTEYDSFYRDGKEVLLDKF